MVRMHRALLLGLLGVAALAGAVARAATPSYVYFFTAINDSYKAYLDTANETTDGQGYQLVSVRIDTFSDAFRGWIKTNFPGGETAVYAIDPYSIDCTGKTIGEHRIVFYDNNGYPLSDYDYGGKMAPPIADSMKDQLMHKVCGF